MSEQVVAVVVAAGLGLRYGGRIPKPSLKLTGKALVSMSVEAMAAAGCTDAVVVLNEKVAKQAGAALAASPIPVHLTLGGPTRQESVHRGLKVIRDDPKLAGCKIVLIHDAVRPMVPADVAEGVINAVRDGAAAVAPAVGVTDSMRRLHPDGSTSIVDRTELQAVQTPQGFPFDVILAAHDRMADLGEHFTDDVSCAELAGHQVRLVPGSRLSMKITEPTDLTVAKSLWKLRASFGHHSGRRVLRHFGL
ncbi:MAG: 2-C-methyl-D-erythritol 4-phosphate cytidylyltransferase [Arachnia sp.]